MSVSDIRKQLFTQLQVNLVKNNINKNADGFEVKFSFNKTLANEFFNDNCTEPNCYIEPVKVSYDKETNKMTFKGKLDDFSSAKDFNKYLTTTIKDNELSSIVFKKGNMLKTFVQNAFLKSEVNTYKLDEMYEKVAKSIAPTYGKLEEEGRNKIDCGAGMRFDVSDDNIVLGLVKKMNELQDYADQKKLKQETPEVKEKSKRKSGLRS